MELMDLGRVEDNRNNNDNNPESIIVNVMLWKESIKIFYFPEYRIDRY